MHSDSLHRLAKSLLDSGEAASLPDAMEAFSKYGVRIRIPPSARVGQSGQIMALTAINAASRSFQGNVLVEADDFELTVRGFEGTKLSDFLAWCALSNDMLEHAKNWPTIAIGEGETERGEVVAWSDGWSFGLGRRHTDAEPFAPACVAAAGLAVSEAFSLLRQDNPYAGRREISMSLWDVRGHSSSPAPVDVPLQESLWLVGLGHLGQAYGWTLGFMQPGPTPLVLQDFDAVTESTLSTSLLSTKADVGHRKTRVVAAWLEARGYKTALLERRFDETQQAGPQEPTVALFGVDNPAARRVVEGAGFGLIIDAGLGAGYRDFRALRMRTFPGPSSAAALWATPAQASSGELAPAYRQLLREGADPCGVTTLATRSVGAPFVGCVAAGFVVAERVRRQLGAEGVGFVDINLRDPQRLEVG
jgi:hypothetical protein